MGEGSFKVDDTDKGYTDGGGPKEREQLC